MIRDFSNAKKEELYRTLDVIDNKEWKPFMVRGKGWRVRGMGRQAWDFSLYKTN